MNNPLVSICITAHKNQEHVTRCLNSVLMQDYPYIEVIISDDSPNEDIEAVANSFARQLRIRYFNHRPPLKSPRNWNFALDQATGDFYMLVHSDDWFHSSQAVSRYVNELSTRNVDFVFSQNIGVRDDGSIESFQVSPAMKDLTRDPTYLVLKNIIGPPSNVMLKRSISDRYDERYIWLVDIEYYIRMLRRGVTYYYINEHLMDIGLHEDQATVFCHKNPHIIISENIWLANELKDSDFNKPALYDYYWRLLRNHNIRSIEDMERNGINRTELPAVIAGMIRAQRKISPGLLKLGPVSKTLMYLCYSLHK